MVIGDIRKTCIRIQNQFKNSDKKRIKELNSLSKFVSGSELFKGKKRKLKKLIMGFIDKKC